MFNDYSKEQRETYKLLENLTKKKFKSEVSLLKSVVHDIVSHDAFEIVGGRVWELIPGELQYVLKYQFGKVKKIPKDYRIKISEQPFLKELETQRVFINKETDNLLKTKGIHTYSVTGVGNFVKVRGNRYYQYLLGFNAPEILQWFYETLSIIGSVTTVAIRNLSSQARQKKMDHDIIKASEIQRSLLPKHKYRFHDYDIFGICIPASEVGGDYFDYIQSSNEEEERLGIVISDAASKGLPAAIQALFLSGAIRMAADFSPRITLLLNRLNTLIWDKFPYERFVSLFYCELTLSTTRLVIYTNAGHFPPIHYRPDQDKIQKLVPTGGILGLMQFQRFGMENIIMHHGDVLVLYTDGIIEAKNENRDLYGEERLIRQIKKYHYESSEVIAEKILESVQRFSAKSEDYDDKTLIVIKRDPNPAEVEWNGSHTRKPDTISDT